MDPEVLSQNPFFNAILKNSFSDRFGNEIFIQIPDPLNCFPCIFHHLHTKQNDFLTIESCIPLLAISQIISCESLIKDIGEFLASKRLSPSNVSDFVDQILEFKPISIPDSLTALLANCIYAINTKFFSFSPLVAIPILEHSNVPSEYLSEYLEKYLENRNLTDQHRSRIEGLRMKIKNKAFS
jgi:hypothetical protein